MGVIRLETLPPSLAETLGMEGSSEEVVSNRELAAGYSVQDLLNRMCRRYRRLEQLVFDPDEQKLSGQMVIFLNGRSLELLDGLETRLQDGDILTFVPFVEGG